MRRDWAVLALALACSLGLGLSLALHGCDGTAGPADAGPPCAPSQLAVIGYPWTSVPQCVQICANQFHCPSGCCLPVGDTGYRACAPAAGCGL